LPATVRAWTAARPFICRLGVMAMDVANVPRVGMIGGVISEGSRRPRGLTSPTHNNGGRRPHRSLNPPALKPGPVHHSL
jgi:hypothetical protein